MFFGFKGFVAVFVGHPFDTIKVRKLIGFLHCNEMCFQSMFAKGGVPGIGVGRANMGKVLDYVDGGWRVHV